MRPLAAALLVLLPACAGPVPVYLSGPFGSAPVEAPPPEIKQILDGGFAWWDLDYVLVTEQGSHVWASHGAIDLTLVDVPDTSPVRGSTGLHGSPCRARVWVDMDPLALAHEIGHVFELDHVDEPANVMARAVEDGVTDYEATTDAQLEQVHDRAALFAACADGA